MKPELYRVVFDNSAVNLKTRPMSVDLDGDQLSPLTEIMTDFEERGFKLVAVEQVALHPDVDMDNSKRWMANLEVTVVLTSEDTANVPQQFSVLPDSLSGLKVILDKVAPTLGLPDLGFSDSWVDLSIDQADDLSEEPASPKI